MPKNLTKILLYQWIVTLALSGFLLLPAFRDSMRYLGNYLWGGSAFAALNFALLYWVWRIVFTKKKIAPLVFAVVSKYAILGLMLWGLSPLATRPTGFLILGVLCNSMALVLYGVIGRNKQTESENGF